MIRRAHILPMLAAALMFFALAPSAYHLSTSYAQVPAEPTGSPSEANLETRDKDGNVVHCGDYDKSKGGILLGRIVPCLVETISNSTTIFTQKMIDFLRPLLYTFLTFVVVMFGVKVMQGEPQIHKQGFLLLVKIAVVVTILDEIPNYIVPEVYYVMAESQEVVSNAIDTSSFHCNIAQYTGNDTPRVWAMMDCVMGKLWGFTSSSATPKQPSMLLGASLFGLAGGFFFGGAFGVTIFFALIGVLVSVFVLVIRTALAFLNGYLVICLMLILCPLFMPLIFMKSTAGYFDGVWKNILASFIMPLMITAYAMFALLMYDQMLFADGSDGRPKSLISKLFEYSAIKDAMQDPRKLCDRQITNDPNDVRSSLMAKDKDGNPIINPFIGNAFQRTLSASNDACALAKGTTFKVDDVNSPDFKNGKATYLSMFETLLELIILGYLIHLGLGSLMSTVRLLSGGGGTVSALMGATSSVDQKLSAGMQQMRASAYRAVRDPGSMTTDAETGQQYLSRDTTGGAFMKRVIGDKDNPGAIKSGINGFFSGMKRE